MELLILGIISLQLSGIGYVLNRILEKLEVK